MGVYVENGGRGGRRGKGDGWEGAYTERRAQTSPADLAGTVYCLRILLMGRAVCAKRQGLSEQVVEDDHDQKKRERERCVCIVSLVLRFV